MVQSSDGFYIAEKDLELRGPGEFFGTRQHGMPDLQLADLVRNMDMMEPVRRAAMKVIADDPDLGKAENADLRKRVEKLFGSDINMKI
jgi:ATP-dependent DNA helicase RecG